MPHDTDVRNDIVDVASSTTSLRNSLTCDIAKASETTPERATWVKEVSQQTEDCNAESLQYYDKESTRAGRCTEPTKDTHSMCAAD